MDSLLHLKYETSNQYCVCVSGVISVYAWVHNLVFRNLPMELLQSDLTDIVEYVHKYAVRARVVHHSELYWEWVLKFNSSIWIELELR